MAESFSMRNPDVRDIYQAIINASEHQNRNSPLFAKICQAGLRDELESLIVQIAANAANPIYNMMHVEEDDSAPVPTQPPTAAEEIKTTVPVPTITELRFEPKTRTYHPK